MIEQLGGLDERFIVLARKYDLQPLYLQQILLLRNQGFNNVEIAEKTGISRITINSYVEKIKEIEKDDLLKLFGFILMAAAGVALFKELTK